MGGAIIGGIHTRYDIAVCEQDQKRLQRLRRAYRITDGSLKTVAQRSEVLILAVKPQSFDAVLKELRPHLTQSQLVISVAAGITCRYIEKRLGAKARVVRTMPNLPAQVGKGMTGICAGRSAKKHDLILARQLFACVGETVVVDEKHMDAVTAASGSGPAYVFLFIEALTEAVRSLNLDKGVAKTLVLQTVKGSLDLLDQCKEEAGGLRARVTSKGGTTQAAMDVFAKHAFKKIFKEALTVAKKRAGELSR